MFPLSLYSAAATACEYIIMGKGGNYNRVQRGSSVQPAAYGRTIELGRTSRGRDFIDEVHMQYLWRDL